MSELEALYTIDVSSTFVRRAYAKYPYPCIRGFYHIALFMSANVMYPRVLELGKSDPSAILLDIGCCSTSPR